MNIKDINLMYQISGEPCVTITLPTHRTAPENQQDQIRLHDLIKQAEKKLLETFIKLHTKPVIENLQSIEKEIDFEKTLDGLVIFASAGIKRVFFLPFDLRTRVVVQDSFYTRDLIYALNRTPRYWVLVLSEKPTRLYEATRKDLVEIKEGDFPMVHEGPGGDLSLPGGFGIRRSAYRDEHHRKFFRSVDNAIRPFLLEDPLPLVVVGVDRYLAFFDKMTAHKDRIIATLKGSHDSTPPHELGELVWPLVKAALQEKRQQVFGELEKAIGERNYASAIGEIYRFARQGRGRILLVEEGFHYLARIDAETGAILSVEGPNTAEELPDVVDEIIENVLRQGGEVIFVEKGKLDVHRGMVLILRY